MPTLGANGVSLKALQQELKPIVELLNGLKDGQGQLLRCAGMLSEQIRAVNERLERDIGGTVSDDPSCDNDGSGETHRD